MSENARRQSFFRPVAIAASSTIPERLSAITSALASAGRPLDMLLADASPHSQNWISLEAKDKGRVFHAMTRESRKFHLSFGGIEHGFASPAFTLQAGGDDRDKLEVLLAESERLQKTDDNTCLYLVHGLLTWSAETGGELHQAPLALLPIEIEAHASGWTLKAQDRNSHENPALKVMFSEDFGLALPPLPRDDPEDLRSFFANVAKVCAHRADWSVDSHALAIMTLSPMRLKFIRDLDISYVRAHDRLNRLNVRAFLNDERFDGENPLALTKDAPLDDLFSCGDLFQVYLCNASETITLQTIRAGSNVVVDSDPEAQPEKVLVNAALAAHRDGKTALIVTKTKADLTRLHNEFIALGLEGLVSAAGIATTRKARHPVSMKSVKKPTFIADPTPDLQTTRTKLNSIVSSLHKTDETVGLSPYQTVEWLLSAREREIVPSALLIAESRAWSPAQAARLVDLVEKLADMTRHGGPLIHHPMLGGRVPALSVERLAQLTGLLEELSGFCPRIATALNDMTAKLDLVNEPAPWTSIIQVMRNISQLSASRKGLALRIAKSDPERIARIAQIARTMVESHAFERFNENAWTLNIDELVSKFRIGSKSLFSVLSPEYLESSSLLASMVFGKLPLKPSLRIDMAESLVRIRKLIEQLEPEKKWIETALGDHWRAENADFAGMITIGSMIAAIKKEFPEINLAALVALSDHKNVTALSVTIETAIEKINELTRSVFSILDIDIDLAFKVASQDKITLTAIGSRATQWLKEIDRYPEWVVMNDTYEDICDLGAVSLANGIAKGSIAPHLAVDTLLTARATSLMQKTLSTNEDLKDFSGLRYGALIERYQMLERQRVDFVIQSLNGRDHGHNPTIALTALSDLSQYHPIETANFDLALILDEGETQSDLFIGAIVRSHQIAVFKKHSENAPGTPISSDLSDLCEAKGIQRVRIHGAKTLTRKFGASAGKIDPRRDQEATFERIVADTLTKSNFLAEANIGAEGLEVDVAIRDSGNLDQYYLAIRCDGLSHFNAQWARERFLEHEKQIIDSGWKYRRIWILDWYHRRDQLLNDLRSSRTL